MEASTHVEGKGSHHQRKPARLMNRVRRVGFLNFGSGRVQVLKNISGQVGSGWVSGISIKYQVNRVLLGIHRVSPLLAPSGALVFIMV